MVILAVSVLHYAPLEDLVSQSKNTCTILQIFCLADEADDTMAGVESSFATEFPDSECDTDAPSGSDQLLLPSILLLLFSFILATAAAN